MHLYNYGVCLFNTGKSQQAETVYKKLIEIDSSYADAYYQLGMVYLGLAKNQEAKSALTKFIQLDPNNPNAATAKEILKSL